MNLTDKELRRSNRLLTVLAVLAAGFMLVALRGVLLPLAIAFFLSYLGMPVIRLGRKVKCPVPILVLMVIALFGSAIGAVGVIFYTSTDQFLDELPRYEDRLSELSDRLLRLPELEKYVEEVEQGETPQEKRDRLVGEAKARVEKAKRDGEEPDPEDLKAAGLEADEPDPNQPAATDRNPTEDAPPGSLPDATSGTDPPEDEIRPAERLIERQFAWGKVLRSGGLVDVAGDVLGGVGNGLLVLVFLIFILLDRGRGTMDARIVTAFSDETGENKDTIRSAVKEIHKEIELYIVTKTLISFLTGSLVAFTLALMDIEFALLFGLLAFTLNYVPNVGWVIASIPPLVVAGLQYDSVAVIVETGLLLLAIHGTIGFIDPLITGKRLHLNPTTVLMSLIIWAWLWGAWGMVLAVPIAAVIRIVSERTGFMHAIGALMSDRQ